MADAGLTLVGQSSLKSGAESRLGGPTARATALRLVLEEVERWHSWIAQQPCLSVQEPPSRGGWRLSPKLRGFRTRPGGGIGRAAHQAARGPDRRIPIEDADCATPQSRAKRFNGSRSTWPWNWTASQRVRWSSAGEPAGA